LQQKNLPKNRVFAPKNPVFVCLDFFAELHDGPWPLLFVELRDGPWPLLFVELRDGPWPLT